MPTLKCDLCEHEAHGETFDEWMKALMPHYIEAHADAMDAQDGRSQEEQAKAKEAWMAENRARFDAA